MPLNVHEKQVKWRCHECIEESGPTRCKGARYKTEEGSSTDQPTSAEGNPDSTGDSAYGEWQQDIDQDAEVEAKGDENITNPDEEFELEQEDTAREEYRRQLRTKPERGQSTPKPAR
jgi:hypothetical protein